MSNPDGQILEYLVPRAESWWRWSLDGQTITWADGRTIAFRPEIEAILGHLAPAGLPPLGSIILLLAACRDGWLESRSAPGLLVGYANSLDQSPSGQVDGAGLVVSRVIPHGVRQEVEQLLEELDAVAALRPELRQPLAARQLLAEVVFETADKQVEPADTTTILQSLHNGLNPQTLLSVGGFDDALRQFAAELEALRTGLPRVSEERLSLRQRTGLEQTVEPAADIELPLSLRVRNLLAHLRDDSELSGIASLARNLLAALHVPRTLARPEALPAGGISDLSNRGSLDRLLISELAHDDQTLAVRIALNEALYLRRESPAQLPPPGRAILLDAGIRMWGIPRVFATAVGLALAASEDRRGTLAVYRARGSTLDSVDLSTRSGLVTHLEALEPHPHPGQSLMAFIDAAQAGDAPTELMLVTHEDVLADADFLRFLHQQPGHTWYFALVSRDGGFRMECTGPGGRKTLSNATLPLDELLAPADGKQKPVSLRIRTVDPALPAILSVQPFPLFLPAVADPRKATVSPRHGLFSVTADGRLMQWLGRLKGGRQLSDEVPPGQFKGLFVDENAGRVHLVAHRLKNRMTVLTVNLDNHTCTTHQLTEDFPVHVCYRQGWLLLIHRQTVRAIHLRTHSREVLGLPPRSKWCGGRFIRSPGGSHAIALPAGKLVLEKVTDQICLAMFEREGDGPWQLKSNGDVVDASGCRITTEKPFRSPTVSFLGASPDGHRIAIRAHAGAKQENYLLELEKDRVWKRIDGDVHRHLLGTALELSSRCGPVRRDCPIPYGVNLRVHFDGISTSVTGELRLHRDRRTWSIQLNEQGSLVLSESNLPTTDVPMMPFMAVESPAGARFKLHVASWTDGSRAYLDSRGMLHLKSINKRLPEVSLVLSDNSIAGWTSEGQTFGWAFFLDGEPTAEPAYVHQVIRAFMRRRS